MNARINKSLPFCKDRQLVLFCIICAVVLTFSGCRHAPVFSNDPKIDVRFTGPDPGDKITRRFVRDFTHHKYLWFHEPKDQIVLMDILRKYVDPAKKEKVVNLTVNGRYDAGEFFLRTITIGLVDIRNYTVKGNIATPAGGVKKRTTQTQKRR